MVYAWNFNSKILSYHGGNRDIKTVNLLTGEIAGFVNDKEKRLLLMHGIVMFIIWGVLHREGLCVLFLMSNMTDRNFGQE